ncbi:MAG TPA: glycosyltransferase family 4 protein [Candidatus Sulfotelmatobacter sp.]|nr:glycosyltransferase family 4 protein [Candidatus Sulfotelmatobacter sp.]
MVKPRLAVFNTQPPHLYFGGVERRIVETAKRLENELDITVYSGTKKGFKQPITYQGARILPYHSTDKIFPLDNWVFNHTISNAVNEIEADLYEAHAVSGYAFLKVLRKKNKKTPFIQTVHGVLADEYLQAQQTGGLSLREKVANQFMRHLSALEAEAARNADIIVTISHYSLKRMIDLYRVDETKIRVAPNGVDPEKFKPAKISNEFKREYGLNNRQVVLFVGRLIPRKGLTYLIKAAAEITKENNNILFLIVGDGPLKEELISQIETLNVSFNFKFVGDAKDNELPYFYNCADIFVLPSIQEGQGIALLEAQACAKPIVAFNIGGVDEAVLNGKSGLLVEKSNSEMLSKAMLDLLSNQTLRDSMGSFGRDFVLHNFTWDICAQKMLKIYEEALTK